MLRPALVSLVLALSCFAQQAGRVEGRVLSPAGEPIAKATVRLNGNSQPQQQGSVYVEVTSREGRFTVENIAPGRYTASAQRPGFTPARNSAGASPLTIVEVAAGETKAGIEIRLAPVAVVSGTITDADGDPVPNSQVRLVRYSFTQGRAMMSANTTTNGDDRGAFRLLNVQPGRYYLLASGVGVQATSNEIRGRSAQEVNLPTYYPNAPDIRGAVAITVGSTEVGNLNIRLRRGGTYSIKGTFVDPGGTPVAGQITVFPKGGDSSPPGITTQVRNDNGFQIGGLIPGDYTIVVRSSPARPALDAPTAPSPVPAPATIRPAEPAAPNLSGRIDVTIGSANLENLTIRLTPGAEISGRLTIEGGMDLPTLMASLPLNIPAPATTTPPQTLVPRMPSISLPALEGPAAQLSSAVNRDGTFSIRNIPPLKRILQVTQLPPSAYVKSVRFGGQDATRAPLDLSTGQGGILEILIDTKGAEITASPRNSNGEAPSGGAPITIWPRIPNPGSATGGVSYSVSTMSFRAQGLAPGEYYVAAWDTTSTEYLTSPDFLARFTSLATKVTVAEGESIAVEPKLISQAAVQAEIAQFP